MGYLVLNLKVGQRILIGDNIEVLISDCDNGRADIAIQAPKEISIKRIPSVAQKEFSFVDKNKRRLE